MTRRMGFSDVWRFTEVGTGLLVAVAAGCVVVALLPAPSEQAATAARRSGARSARVTEDAERRGGR
jgi:hypothetical protein